MDAHLPSVRFLVLDGADLSGSLAHLPNLESIFLSPPHRAQMTGLIEPPPLLKDVLVLGPGLVPAFQGCPLERLQAICMMEPEDMVFPNLRWLKMTPRSGVGRMLRDLVHLERLSLELDSASVARLSLLGAMPRLEECQLFSSGLKDLAGIEEWHALRRLRLHLTAVRRLDLLADSPVEELVFLRGGRSEIDIAPLRRMQKLRTLELNLLGQSSSLGDWCEALALERVELRDTLLGPRGLDGLAEAPALRSLALSADNAHALERFRQARPDVELTVWPTSGPGPEARLGHVGLKHIGDEWSIFTDLTQLLGTSTNHDAERLVNGALSPAIRNAVEFDAEAGGFCAIAKDRETIAAVAAVINALADAAQ